MPQISQKRFYTDYGWSTFIGSKEKAADPAEVNDRFCEICGFVTCGVSARSAGKCLAEESSNRSIQFSGFFVVY